jgi:hypothetical protein
MYAKEPAMAKRWEKETPKGKLPDKAKSSAAMKGLHSAAKRRT